MCLVNKWLAYILVMNGCHVLINKGKLWMMRIMVASACLIHISTFSRGFIMLGLWQMLNIVCCLYFSVLNSLTNLLIQPDPRKLLLSPNEWSVHPLWNCTCRVQFSGWYQESVPHLDQPRWVHNSSFCLIWLALAVLSRQGFWRTCSKIYRCNQEFDLISWILFCSFILCCT
jgi:hypothetical protein